MRSNWGNFFAAFDPAQFVSVDEPPLPLRSKCFHCTSVGLYLLAL
jgi:hypothetical protein